MKKEDFYTKHIAEAGVKMPLTLEDGSDSGHWLQVRGTDSDSYKKAQFDGVQTVRNIPDNADEWTRTKAVDGVVLDTLTALVADWSFDEPCTPQAVREFLGNAPQIADSVDRISADRKKFFTTAASQGVSGSAQ